jgi:hypothetical protein
MFDWLADGEGFRIGHGTNLTTRVVFLLRRSKKGFTVRTWLTQSNGPGRSRTHVSVR